MFQKSLTEIDRIFTNDPYSEFTIDEWQERQHILLKYFHEDIKPLIDLLLAKPFNDILKYSKCEILAWPPNHIQIVEVKISPKSDYYKELGKIIPQPDNQQGPHATGIELSIGIFRGAKWEKVISTPFIEIEFKIWGHEERKEFIQFYKNYRRTIELLLNKLELAFFTSCCFNNLDKYRGTSIINKIDLYISNKKDEEASFSLKKSFNKNAGHHKITEVFNNLLIIYHCCFGYCKKNKEIDRILNFSDISLMI
jgi:hypothetical protein